MINAEDAVATFEGRQGEILIRTHVLNGQVRLEVSDNGAGIRSRDMGRIFDPFFSTKAASPGGSGTGLGLNICAEIVKDHGGELYAWSTYGTGSTFTVELPVASVQSEKETPPGVRSDSNALAGKSVMVVDDEVTITELMDEYLVLCGAKVEFFNSGSDAFDRLCVQSYDAIVCDQRMPGLNGQSLYRMVESLDPELASRFIFVTGDVLNDRSRQFFAQTGRPVPEKAFPLRGTVRGSRDGSLVRTSQEVRIPAFFTGDKPCRWGILGRRPNCPFTADSTTERNPDLGVTTGSW